MNPLLFEVWTPASVVAAVVAGFGVGYWIIGRVAADPAWASPQASPAALGALVAVLSMTLGLVFYAGQAMATYLDGDPNWPRVIWRLGPWLLCGACLGLGTWRRVADHIAARKALARIRAEKELGG